MKLATKWNHDCWAWEAEADIPGPPVIPMASENPEGTICIPADQAPKSVFVYKGLVILDLSSDLTMERLVLSTNIDDQNIRGC